MRVPLEWLADYVSLEQDTSSLAHTMTMGGLKVESIERLGEQWRDVVIGQVVELEPHPTSKKPLGVARVDIGGRTITVVTGAPNVRQGDKVAAALVGSVLPHGPDGNPIRIDSRPMAGIVSEGMLASARELGIGDEHSGLYILPPDAPVGEQLRTVMGEDVVDVETQPNRPDTLSMVGIAREVAAMTQQQTTLPSPEPLSDLITVSTDPGVAVRVEDPDLCPRYTAIRVDGVETVPSPLWLTSRLQAAGMRPINLLVDLTNYVMLEYGQPMHAFDVSQVREETIVVRRAMSGESITTLDGVRRELPSDALLICDAERPVGIAGVMGGENTEISEGTTSLVLESATFVGSSVRRTARELNLRTEASSRFEKGLPPEQALPAAWRFVQLLVQVTGAPVTVGRPVDVWSGVPEARSVTMPLRDLHRLTGLSIDRDTAAEKLRLLEFGVAVDGDLIHVDVPYWRRADIFGSADVVEEVVRLVGYETVPLTLPRRTVAPPAPAPAAAYADELRQRLFGMGVNEAVTGTLTSVETVERLLSADPALARQGVEAWPRIVVNAAGVYAREALAAPIRLINPPTQERAIVRPTLLPGLLGVVARNRKHTDERLAFFEMAPTFFPRPANLPYERRTLALVLGGRRRPASWIDPRPGPFTFFDLKGMIEALLSELRIEEHRLERAGHPALHPGRGASLILEGREVAIFGEAHPLVAAAFELGNEPVQVAEIDLDALLLHASEPAPFQPVSRFPPALRDIAVVVADDVAVGEILRSVRQAGDQLVHGARVFDVYTGAPLAAGTKSVALGLELRAPGATLSADEIEAVMANIVEALGREHGATLRD